MPQGTPLTSLEALPGFMGLFGQHPSMRKVFDVIRRVGPSDVPVLITGESGTGKELVARAIHQVSRRRRGPFVAVNCGAIPAQLAESELFGHMQGAFTGAVRSQAGAFERAHGGTLFLDEVTEMPLELQVKLLRVLETGTVTRIGGEKPVGVDVRVVAATNRNPEQSVRDGKLREDLWYRLNVFPISLPPLRQRGGDIALLAWHFLGELNAANGTSKRWGDSALAALEGYAWPGNVRELKNLVHRAFILADLEVDAACLPTLPSAEEVARASADGGELLHVRVGSSVADVEKRLIFATLEQVAGNKQKAAEILGVSLKTLYNRLSAYKTQ